MTSKQANRILRSCLFKPKAKRVGLLCLFWLINIETSLPVARAKDVHLNNKAVGQKIVETADLITGID